MRFPSKADCLKSLKRAGLHPASVIDVGVHTGTPELMAAYPKAHHLLVEPESAHAEAIAAAYADIPHTLVAAAASDRDGTGKLMSEHRGGRSEVTHSRLDPIEGRTDSGAASQVRLARLDSLVKEAGLTGPYLLKIDTDGHELEVLAGAGDTLRQSAIVIIEAPLHALTERAMALESAGLRLLDIIDLAYYHDTLSQVDLVFVNPAVADPGALNPWRRPEFDWRAWRQLRRWTSALDPVRRLAAGLRRRAARAMRSFQ
jgi:FkbM family methyltransferase